MKAADSASRSLESVRPARPDESKLLASLHVATWQQAYEGLLPAEYLASLTPDQRLPMWEHLLPSPEKVAIFVADSDGEPIGFSCGGISNDQDAETTTGELWSIYLLRDFWNLGIGKQLQTCCSRSLRGVAFTRQRCG